MRSSDNNNMTLLAIPFLIVVGFILYNLVTSLDSNTIKYIDVVVERNEKSKELRAKNLNAYFDSPLLNKYDSYIKEKNVSKWLNNSFDYQVLANRDVASLLAYKERDSRSDQPAISLLLNQATVNINKYLEYSSMPKKFLADLDSIETNFDEVRKKQLSSANESSMLFDANILLASELMKNKYAIDVNQTLEVLNKELTQNKLAKASLNEFVKKIENMKKEKDILSMQKIISDIEQFKNLSENSQKRLKNYKEEINSSYLKTLTGMREDYFVTISSTSWDDTYDYPSEHKILYKRKMVSREVFDSLKSVSHKIASDYTHLFTSFRLHFISQSDWDALGIDSKYAFKRYRNDTDVEFYVEDLEITYSQSFSIIENDKETKTGLIEVSEADYIKHYDSLGMTIYSKPYGVLLQHADTKPSPPGLSIAGNKHYTKEGTNNSSNSNGSSGGGNSFFHYYGIYSMFAGNNYSRDDVYDYRNRDRSRGYYKTHSGLDYGTYSSKASNYTRPSRIYNRNQLKSVRNTYKQRSIRNSRSSSRSSSRGSSSRKSSSSGNSLRTVKSRSLSRSPKSGK